MRKHLFVLSLILSLSIVGLVSLPLGSPFAVFVVRGAGNPDAYGNQILNLTVEQDTGGAWVTRGIITDANYTLDTPVYALIDQDTRFSVLSRVNYTWFSNSSDVLAGARVSIIIEDNVSDYMTNDEVELITEDQGWLLYSSFVWAVDLNAWNYNTTLIYSSVGNNTALLNNPTNLNEQPGDLGVEYGDFAVSSATFDQWDFPLIQNGYYYAGAKEEDRGVDYPYFWKSAFEPFNGADAFSLEAWVFVAHANYTTYFVSSYSVYARSCRIYIQADGRIVFHIGNSTHYSNGLVSSINNRTMLHLVLTWYSGAKGTLYINATTTYEGSKNLTGLLSANEEMCINAHKNSDPRSDGDTAYYEVSIWSRPLTPAEVLTEFNGGPDFIGASAGLNNSWTFNEVSSGLYDYDEQVLHDGLEGQAPRETWQFDYVGLTLAGFNFPWPITHVEEWTVLIAMMMLCVVPTLLLWYGWKKKNAGGGWFEMLFWGFLAVSAFTLFFMIVVTGGA